MKLRGLPCHVQSRLDSNIVQLQELVNLVLRDRTRFLTSGNALHLCRAPLEEAVLYRE